MISFTCFVPAARQLFVHPGGRAKVEAKRKAVSADADRQCRKRNLGYPDDVPWQNDADESFNGKFRDECLSVEWFRTRTAAKVVIEQ